MIIGITGGVGTGKSTILGILKDEYNAAIIIADDIARDLMMPGEGPYKEIVEYFGYDILSNGPESPIDRAHLADIVFYDSEKLLVLNGIVHPAVKRRIEMMIEQYRSEGFEYIVVETAILIQAGYLDMIDELWVVYTDYDIRVKRLEESRGYTKEKTDSIINSQLPASEMESHADLVIDNSYDIENTFLQIQERLGVAGNKNK